MTAATVAVLPVITSPPLVDVTSKAWEGLSGSTGSTGTDPGPAPSPGPVSGSAPAGGTTGTLEPTLGTGTHRAEDPEPSADPAPEPAPVPSEAPPEAPAPEPPPEPELTATYRVVWGDTLSTIGADHGMTWRQVHEANADVIGPNPNLVIVGTVLRVLPA